MVGESSMLTLGTGLYALAMLALVLGLILGLGWLMRTYGTRWGLGATRAEPTLKVTQRLPLNAQHTLVEVTEPTHRTLLLLGPGQSVVVAREVLKRPKKTRPK